MRSSAAQRGGVNRPYSQSPDVLRRLRQRIDGLDARLLRLLTQRATLAGRVGEFKRRRGLRLFDPARERAILQRMTRANRGPLSAAAIRAIYRQILTQIRRLEQSV